MDIEEATYEIAYALSDIARLLDEGNDRKDDANKIELMKLYLQYGEERVREVMGKVGW